MTKERKTDVLVVGAGPVGLFAAANLAEQGVAVEVVDEAWRPATHGYALALHPRSLELLDDLGLADSLISVGQRIDKVAFYEGSERRVTLDLGTLDAKFPFVLALPQRELETVLKERLRKRKVKPRWNHRVSDLEANGEDVSVSVDRMDRVSGGYPVATTNQVVVSSSRTRATFVIGADGGNSLVRKKLGASFDQCGDPFRVGVFEFAADLEAANEMRVVLDGASRSGLWPLPDGRCRWTFQLPLSEEDESGRVREGRAVTRIGQRAYPQVALARLSELVAQRAPWFDSEVGELFWSIEVAFERRLSSVLGHGRVWLAGDATHLMFPVGMQSMNVGLEEARRLSSVIAARLRGEEREEIFEVYRGERSEELRLLLAAEDALVGREGAQEWVSTRRQHVVDCLPSCGDEIVELLDRLGLERTTPAGDAADR